MIELSITNLQLKNLDPIIVESTGFLVAFFLEFENSANVIAFFIKVTEMEAILQQHNNTMPAREVLVALAEKFRYVPF